MASKRTEEVLLHQISLPARRDYQLRSCSLKSDGKSSGLHVAAFHNARAISFNASHEEVPFVLHHAGKRPFYSGPLTSQATAMGRPNRASTTVAGHAREHSESDASFATADSLGQSDDFSEVSQEQESHHVIAKDVIYRSAERRPLNDAQYLGSRGTPTSNKAAGRTEEVPVVKPTYVLTPRKTVSGDLRASRSTMSSRVGCTELMLISQAGRASKMNQQSGGKVTDGTCGPRLNEKGAGDSRRRPTASIAWDSLNKSQENSPQHELAAVPFKWEDSPGKPKTIAAAAERAMARRLHKEGSESRSSARELQQRSTRKSHIETPSYEEIESGRGMLSSPNSSFRSSHRFYARTALGERSFGPRSSVDSGHVISEVETEAHIDLVAPAAAKFLVESWVSPNVTPEPNLTTTIPFKWEEAPGKPKTEDAMECSKPAQLQLPPRLAVPPPVSVDARESRGRQRTRSMSGPLAGYYPHTSPARRRQQQQSPPVMRSCSPSKRSISPSKIQALAKHFSRKVSAVTTPTDGPCEVSQNYSAQNKNLRHSYTCGHNSGPLEDYRGRGGSTRALVRSASGAFPDLMNSEQDDPYWPKSAQLRAARSFASGPLDSAAKPKRYSSPSKRSISPSRIHALAKQLTCKIRPPPEGTLEDPNWPVSIKQVMRPHSFTLVQSSASLDRAHVNTGAVNEEYCPERMSSPTSEPVAASHAWMDKQDLGRDPWSPTSILQGPNEHSDAHPSAPSSASDMDNQTQATTPPSIILSKSLSKSLSRVSYESFEHSFTEPASPANRCPSAAEDAVVNSPLDSPYLGPTSTDYRSKDFAGGAAESVKAIIKMCRTGSTWRKTKTHSPEMWAPTLASYFQCLEATMSNSGTRPAALTHTEHQEGDSCRHGVSSPAESIEAQTRLPYTMPSHVEQKLANKDYCDSPNAEFTSCLGVKLSPARFVSRGEYCSAVGTAVPWSDRHLGHSIPTNNMEDGYRSPAYAATLELLSPSAELIRKKKGIMGTSRGVKLGLPSSTTRRGTHYVEAMCKSLKRALYKCAKRCCRKTVKLQYNEDPAFASTEFSFSKPN